MIQPLREQVLVKRTNETETKAGGLIIPTSLTRPVFRAEIVAVGSGPRYSYGPQPSDVKAGDTILCAEGAGFDVREDGIDYVLIPETSIMAIVKK